MQLAAPIIADQGLGEFSLDDVSTKAGVTRNLLYHYFPRGRHDIIVAVAEWAGEQLSQGWAIDETVPLPERMAANFQHLFDHAMGPSVPWRLNRMGQSVGDQEIDEVVDRTHEAIVSAIALNQLGTTDPPQLVRLTIKAAISFTESLLDLAREQGVPREQSLQVVAQTLVASIQAGLAASK